MHKVVLDYPKPNELVPPLFQMAVDEMEKLKKRKEKIYRIHVRKHKNFDTVANSAEITFQTTSKDLALGFNSMNSIGQERFALFLRREFNECLSEQLVLVIPQLGKTLNVAMIGMDTSELTFIFSPMN